MLFPPLGSISSSQGAIIPRKGDFFPVTVRNYEFTVLIQPQLEESARKALVERYAKAMEESGGTAPVINLWGLRTLAYEINRFREAYYVLYEGPIQTSDVAEMERTLNINENVLRYLFIAK